MTCSPARLAANRANAQMSTGPRTPEGKERSRGNAFKHGMAGEGIALPAEDQAEVSRVFAGLRQELGPEGEVAEALVRRVALLTIRLDRCVLNDSATLSTRVRSAESDFDEARHDEVDRLMAGLPDDPATAVRKLRRMPEGVDRMVAAWLALRADVACAAEDRWGAEHRRMAENLAGRRPGDIGTSRVEALARAIRGDFTHLGPLEGPGRDDRARSAWARDRMAELIDAEVEWLSAHRATLDLAAIAADRAGAPARVLFDLSKEGQLARRYEAEAERGLYRALREIRQQARADDGPPASRPKPPEPGPVAIAQAEILASYRGAASAGLLTPLPPPNRPARSPRDRPMPPSRRDRPGINAPRDASTIVVGRG